MAISNVSILEQMCADAARRELGHLLPAGFMVALDPRNAEIFLVPPPDTEGQPPCKLQAPKLIWRATDKFGAHMFCDLRLIAIRQQLEAA